MMMMMRKRNMMRKMTLMMIQMKMTILKIHYHFEDVSLHSSQGLSQRESPAVWHLVPFRQSPCCSFQTFPFSFFFFLV